MTGVVIHFNSERGFGFIRPESGGDDVFCHFSGIVMGGYKKLQKGQRVEYSVENGPKGIQACDVKVIS